MTFDPEKIARPWLLGHQPYTSERDVYGHDGFVFLDANENPYGGNGVNRYPGPEVTKLYGLMADLYGVERQQLLITPGSDEAIALLVRAFCEPGTHRIAVCPPTFGMYALSAKVNGVDAVSVPLINKWDVDWAGLESAFKADANLRMVFLCTPQNPASTSIKTDEIKAFATQFSDRLIIVDEAYQEFNDQPSMCQALADFPNVVVMRTMSKTFGIAGARVGAMIADPRMCNICSAMMTPYAIPSTSAQAALNALTPAGLAQSKAQIAELLAERTRLQAALETHPDVIEIYPSAANFLMVVMKDAAALQERLLKDNRILVRNQTKAIENGLRVGIGTPDENDLLLQALGLAPAPAPQRKAELKRETHETSIYVSVNLDDPKSDGLETGVGFFDHMLEQLTKHSGIGLTILTKGDTHIDTHHTVEDTMIALGAVLDQAVGDKKGILRYGHFDLVMDEARAVCSLDLSGRAYVMFDGDFATENLGGLQTQMIKHCIVSLAEKLRATIHVTVTGDNDHHKCEAVFKALAKALKMAVRREGSELMSTKGLL